MVRRRREKFAVDRDFILMGDFNVPNRRHRAYAALTGDGRDLRLPAGLLNVKGTNLSRENTYDQILHSPTPLNRFSGRGGVVDFYRDDWQALYPEPRHRPADARAFTYELSDHLPLWMQVRTELMDERLQIMAGRKPPPRRARGRAR